MFVCLFAVRLFCLFVSFCLVGVVCSCCVGGVIVFLLCFILVCSHLFG